MKANLISMKRHCPIKMKSVLACALLWTVLSGAQLIAAPVSARQLPRLMPSPESALQRAAEIGLTAEQRTKLEADLRELGGESGRLTEQVRRESDALAQLLAAGKPDESAVAAQFEKVLAAENEVKRVRLKMSLRTRAVLTPEQQQKLATQSGRNPRAAAAPEQPELAAKMERLKELIARAKQGGRDMSSTRELWRRVEQLTQEGRASEAGRLLDETARELEAGLVAPQPKP